MKYDIVKLMARRKIRWKKRWVSGDSGGRLTFRSKKAGTLENYRIYGNTVGGESVGDLVESGEHAGEYKVDVTVEGKNLLQNTATSQTIKGVTFTVNEDGSVTCNGTANGGTALFWIPAITLPAGQYSINGCPVGGTENTTYKILILANNEWLINDMGSGANFTLTETSTVSVRIAIYNGYTCDNLTFYPMIRRADIEDDTYEPYHAPVTTPIYLPEQIKMVGKEAEYIDYAEQKQHRVRKNLLQNTATSQTINGVTFTVNSDRSVTCNGTATQTAVHILNNTFSLEPGTYNLTGCPAGGGYVDKYKMDVVIPPIAYGTDIGDGSSFTLSSTLTNALYRIIIYAGQTCNNLTFYPMIRKADIEDDTYEPYHAPVTTPIYLPEQIRKAGDDAEYIDFAEQKMHRIGADDIDVTLPALPTLTGTNVLSVGTAVQPSRVEVKGRIKAVG